MKIIFNLLKYSQEDPANLKRMLSSGIERPSGEAGDSASSAPSPASTSVSGGSSAVSSSSIDYPYALSRAKQILMEHKNDPRAAQVQLNEEILKKLDINEKKKLMREIEFFAASANLHLLHQEKANQDTNLSELAQQISAIVDEEGVDNARTWIEYKIKDDRPDLYGSAINILEAYEKGTLDIANIAGQSQDRVESALGMLNGAAVKALRYIAENQSIDEAMDKCPGKISDKRLRSRVVSAIIQLQAKSQPIFSRSDLIGSDTSAKTAYSDFLGMYVALHSRALLKGQRALIQGPAHDYINKIFKVKKQAQPLGSAKNESKHIEEVKENFADIDGGMHTHILPDGKYMFEHIAQEMANGLNQTPPEESALCIVLIKLESLAESTASRAIAMSQLGGRKNKEGEETEVLDMGSSNFAREANPTKNPITSYVPNQAGQVLQILEKKTNSIKSTLSKVATEANAAGFSNIAEYFTSASARLDAALASNQNWLKGVLFAEKANSGYSPHWHNRVETARKEQLWQEIKINKDKEALDTGDLSHLNYAPITRSIDGIRTTISLDFKPAMGMMSNRKISVPVGNEIRSIDVPVHEPVVSGVDLKDVIAEGQQGASEEDKKVFSQLKPYISSSATIGGQPVALNDRIDGILNIFRLNESSFLRAAKVFKQAVSGSYDRIGRALEMENDSIPRQITATGAILNKTDSPTMESLLEARRILPPQNYFNLLAAISARMIKSEKVITSMTPALSSSIGSFLRGMLANGRISDPEYEQLNSFRATPQTAVVGRRTATANEVEAWIKVMARMML